MNHAHRCRRTKGAALIGAVALVLGSNGCGAPQPEPPRLIDAGCPAVMPGTSNANEDFADMVIWNKRAYINAGARAIPAESTTRPAQPDREVGKVTCSLVDGPLAGVNDRLANLPWPDGTATALLQGEAIYAVRGQPTRCVVAARRDDTLGTYVAVDTSDNSLPPLCSQ